MENEILKFASDVVNALQTGGWLTALGVFLAGFIGVWKTSFVQGLLPRPLQWVNWSIAVRTGVAFLIATTGAWVLAIAGGVAGWTALGGAIAAGLAAMGGQDLYSNVFGPPKTSAKVKATAKDPKAGLKVPIEVDRIPRQSMATFWAGVFG